MKNLKNNSLFFLLFLVLSACQSSPVFELKTSSEPGRNTLYDHHAILVRSDHVQQECMFLNAEGDNKWRHQYFMYILTDKKEVLPIMYSINQDKETCQKQIKKIQKILRQEAQVKVCANSELKKETKKLELEESQIKFTSQGSYKVIYEALFLDSICNSKECFIYNDVSANVCSNYP